MKEGKMHRYSAVFVRLVFLVLYIFVLFSFLIQTGGFRTKVGVAKGKV